MAIRWKIPFKTLRSNALLTVNVYDSTFSGTAMVLKGAAQPFETQEDGDDDIFTPVRLQSGYLRIVDDGFAADGVTAFNWRDFIPTTDTDRPVTLTDANNNVLWQGFMQAQNFGATLFGNPQTREFPIQCSLSVTQGIDINFDQKAIKNFAYLLKQVIDSIPSTCRPTSIVVQGDAFLWLPKTIDWQLFVDEDEDYTAIAKYKVYECLEEMCKFWGWTARTAGQTLFLLCPDDTSVPRLFTFTYAQLSTLADNGSVEIIPSSFPSVTIADGFANNDNKDYQMRGASKATFGINTDSNDEVIELFDHRLEIVMEDEGWTTVPFDDAYFMKTGDIYNVERTGFFAAVTTSQLATSPASFNRLRKGLDGAVGYGYGDAFNVIMFKRTYASSSPAQLVMQTKYMHSFSDGFFRFLGDTYVGAEKYEQGDYYAGNWDMIVKFGVGTSRNNAMWWDGRAWGSTEVSFRLTLGNKKPELFSRYVTGSGFSLDYEETSIINTNTLYGYVYLEFYGSDNMPETDGQRAFNIGNFKIEFTKNNTVKKQQFPNSGWYSITDKEIEHKAYKSENNNAIFDEYSTESIFASEKESEPNYGIVLNANGSYASTISYDGVDEHPEQHFVNRVTSYWATSKRKIEANLLTHDGTAATNAASVTPKHMVTIDGTTMHPIAFSHKWWDDEVAMTLMECVTTTPTVSHTISANAANTSLNGFSTSVSEGASWQGSLTPNTGYNISSVSILMGNTDITSTAYNSSTGAISIASVTGNVVITAVAAGNMYSVFTDLTNITSNAPAQVQHGSALQVTLTPSSGYAIDASSVVVTMGGTPLSGVYSSGVVTINSVTGNVAITAEAAEILPYDAEVEYIESDGYAFINTGLKIASNIQFDFSLYLGQPQGNKWFFGGRTSSSAGNMMCQLDINENKRYDWRYGNGTNASTSSNTLVYGAHRIHNTTAARSLVITNPNTTYTLTRTASTFSTNVDFMLFTAKLSEDAVPTTGTLGMKFYSGKMYSGGTLVRDYIPVRKNGVGYLYDKVSKTLFGNAAGTGSFTYGNDKTT